MACPFLQNVQPEASPTSCPLGATTATATKAASCPLGFGAAGTALPSPLHCTQCRGLLHDSVLVEACGHNFCRFCVAPFARFGCPVCGVDVDSLKPDHETNGLVAKFLDIHAGNPSLWTKMAGVPPSQDTSRAGFLLLLGMQSYAGGNMAAALSRLQACKRELMLQAASGGEAGTDSSLAAACVKAGAVCGTLADCYKQMAERAPTGPPSTASQQAPTTPPPTASQPPQPAQQQEQGRLQGKQMQQQQQRTEPDPRWDEQQEPHGGGARAGGCPFHSAAVAGSKPGAAQHMEATPSGAVGQAASSSAAAGPERPVGDSARQSAVAAGCPHMQQQQEQQEQAVEASCPHTSPGGEERLGEGGGQLEETAEQLLDHAADLYREGIELLGPHAGTDPEAVHALAVTHNKLGDLHYVRGDLQKARQCYVRGLAVRQAALDLAGGPSGGLEGEALALDVAVSSIKVADASKALGDSTAVDKFCSKARQLLLSVQAGQGASGTGSVTAATKCQHLLQLLDSGLAAL